MFKNLFQFYQKEQIVKEINLERVKKIIVEASEQSNRISIPEINKPESLKNFFI